MHVKKNDEVVVLSGKDKGKKGIVLVADPKNAKLIVEGVSMAKHHVKARKPGEESGIIKKEIPIYASKVMRVCPKCGKPTREAHAFLKDGSKVRACKKCGETI